MNYKVVGLIFLVVALIIPCLWGFSFYLFDDAKKLYDEHHGMHFIDKGEYAWLVSDYPSEEWVTVRYQWKQKYDIAMFVSDIAVYSTSTFISVILVCGLDYIFYRIKKAVTK